MTTHPDLGQVNLSSGRTVNLNRATGRRIRIVARLGGCPPEYAASFAHNFDSELSRPTCGATLPNMIAHARYVGVASNNCGGRPTLIRFGPGVSLAAAVASGRASEQIPVGTCGCCSVHGERKLLRSDAFPSDARFASRAAGSLGPSTHARARAVHAARRPRNARRARAPPAARRNNSERPLLTTPELDANAPQCCRAVRRRVCDKRRFDAYGSRLAAALPPPRRRQPRRIWLQGCAEGMCWGPPKSGRVRPH